MTPGIAELLPQLNLVHHIPGCEHLGRTFMGAEACPCRPPGTPAYAYVNHGRWIADCTRRHCANAESLSPKQTMLHCSNCRLLAEVVWPPDPDAITDALAVRPVPQTRNWAPAGHRQALATRHPDGQTVADLIAETHEHEETA
jgi:hypothetical protein